MAVCFHGGPALRVAVVAAFTCVVAAHAASAPEDVYEAPPLRIQPDPAWQRLMQSVVDAKDANGFDERLIPLRRLAESDWPACFAQLLHFHSRLHDDPAMRDAIIGRILHGLHPTRHAAITAIVPHLDNEDASIRDTARRLLAHYDDRAPTRDADFAPYRDIIEQNVRLQRPTSESLIRHLYTTDAALSLKTLIRACQLRDLEEIRAILVNERAIAQWQWKRRYGIEVLPEDEQDARRALEAMAGHARWWVRLYAVAMMQTHAELITPAALGRVANDGHHLVREAVLALPAHVRPGT